MSGIDQRQIEQRRVDQRPGIRPRASLGRRLDAAARSSFPGGICVLLMVLAQAPLGVPEQAVLLPAITVNCVWFWSLHRPAGLPPPVVFLIGVLLDLLGTLPLGVGVFTLLVVQAVALGSRRGLSRHGFVWVWLAFAGVAAGAALILWLLVMLLTFRVLSPYPAIFIAVLAVALFPVLAVAFTAAQRLIATSALI